MAKEWIKYTVLCRLLRVTERGRMLRAEIKSHARLGGMYSVASANEFLRRCARNFEQPPTLDDLMSGRVILLKAGEIKQRYPKLTPMKLRSHRQKGELAYLRFPASNEENGAIRYRQSDIQRIAGMSSATLVNLEQAARFLGLRVGRVRKLMWRGELKRVENLHDRNHAYVSRESLMCLLRERLPAWVTPEDWVEDCNATTEPLIPLDQAEERLGFVQRESLLSFLKKTRVLCIRGPKGGEKIMISPLWIARFDEKERALTAPDIARLFGVHSTSVHRWWRSGLLVCPIVGHKHSAEDAYLRRVCWIAILKKNCSPGLQISRFVTTRLDPESRAPAKLVSHQRVVAKWGCPELQIAKLAESGVLRGVRTPAGTWMLYARSVSEAEKLHRQ